MEYPASRWCRRDFAPPIESSQGSAAAGSTVNRIFTGLVAGLASTVCMTIWEAFFYRRYGLEACLDWEINQHLISRANGREPAANLGLGLALHGFVGAVAGGAFASLRPRMLLAASGDREGG